jgi:DNA-binding transcriptional ArsR family regulator
VTALLCPESRWALYRVLSEPVRLKLLALAAEEELSVGELAELLGEGQPNVSRHAAALRQAGVLSDRRHGTRTLVRLAAAAAEDPVVFDALAAGRGLASADRSLQRVAAVVRSRDARGREFFAAPPPQESSELARELPAYAAALGAVIETRRLAVDAGTGDGALLDVLAPVFEHVVAVDRSRAQLERARRRVAHRGYSNVEFVCAEADAEQVQKAVGRGADLVIASRVLHHAPLPRVMVAALARLVAPGGKLVVIDYAHHEDDELREQQADVWMGFEPAELTGFAADAGLVGTTLRRLPAGYVSGSVDGHLGWLVLEATRGSGPAPGGKRQHQKE